MKNPPLPVASFTDWPEACLWICREFRVHPDEKEWGVLGHDANACHFEAVAPGPDYALLGIDWVAGTLRYGSIYMPKQDGGYHAALPLPSDWLRALRELRLRTWGESPGRFSSLSSAAAALLPVVEQVRCSWFVGPFYALEVPASEATGGDWEIIWGSAGHPFDLLAVGVNRSTGEAKSLFLEAGVRGLEWGRSILPQDLVTDLRATPRGVGFNHEVWESSLLADWLEAAVRKRLRECTEPAGLQVEGPLQKVFSRMTPERWRIPELGIQFSGPSWTYGPEGVTCSTYGRYRLTGGWVQVVFSLEFETASFVDHALGAQPSECIGRVEIPEELRESFKIFYRPKS